MLGVGAVEFMRDDFGFSFIGKSSEMQNYFNFTDNCQFD